MTLQKNEQTSSSAVELSGTSQTYLPFDLLKYLRWIVQIFPSELTAVFKYKILVMSSYFDAQYTESGKTLINSLLNFLLEKTNVGYYTSHWWLHKQTNLIFSCWIVLNKSNYFCIDLLKYLRCTVHIFSIFKMDGWVQKTPQGQIWAFVTRNINSGHVRRTLMMDIQTVCNTLFWIYYGKKEKDKKQKTKNKQWWLLCITLVASQTDKQSTYSAVDLFWIIKKILCPRLLGGFEMHSMHFQLLQEVDGNVFILVQKISTSE